jgi:hypothetical protein
MNKIKLPPDVEFHEDVRLLVWRPRGLLNEASINKVLSVLEDLKASLQEPFNRFTDTVGADQIELNFKYVIQFSLHRRLSYTGHHPVKSAILASDSTPVHYVLYQTGQKPSRLQRALDSRLRCRRRAEGDGFNFTASLKF